MKIVIDINDNEYLGIKNYPDNITSYPVTIHLYEAVRNGTPLPKGHGRLIDANMLPICHGVFLPRVNGNTLGCPADAVFVSDIEDAPTIIDADKESGNGEVQ